MSYHSRNCWSHTPLIEWFQPVDLVLLHEHFQPLLSVHLFRCLPCINRKCRKPPNASNERSHRRLNENGQVLQSLRGFENLGWIHVCGGVSKPGNRPNHQGWNDTTIEPCNTSLFVKKFQSLKKLSSIFELIIHCCPHPHQGWNLDSHSRSTCSAWFESFY